jgi:hypothetical protein
MTTTALSPGTVTVDSVLKGVNVDPNPTDSLNTYK